MNTKQHTEKTLKELQDTLENYVYHPEAFDMDLRISVVVDQIRNALTERDTIIVAELEKYRQSLSIKNEAERRQRIALSRAINLIKGNA